MIRAHLAVSATTAILLAGCGVIEESVPMQAGEGAVFEGPVARASCGPGSVEETGLQGQVTLDDRVSGRSLEGYRCNLEPVGQFGGDGASWQMTWFEDCAYYGTSDGANVARDAAMRGVVTLDVSNPAEPKARAYLNTLGMRDPWESLKAEDKRGLLAAVHQNGPELDVYDIGAADCHEPKLLFSGPMLAADGTETSGHAGNWAQTGDIYYGAQLNENPYAYDLTDPTAPRIVAEPADFPGAGTHDLSTSADGTRLYKAQVDDTAGNGLVIVDVTAIRDRRPKPVVSPISQLTWEDGKDAQQTLPIRIAGVPYILFTDESAHGGARLIDIRDEKNPVVVAKLKLEVQMPENASAIAGEEKNGARFGYEAHYCGVDDPEDTTTIACGFMQSGIRVFDVRQPRQPREIAYYYPPLPAAGTAVYGSQNSVSTNAPFCTAQVRLIPERGELWTTCQDNGFLVLRFTNDAWPLRP